MSRSASLLFNVCLLRWESEGLTRFNAAPRRLSLSCRPSSSQGQQSRPDGRLLVAQNDPRQTCRSFVRGKRQPGRKTGSVMSIGVDTHKVQHVLVALDDQGRRCGVHHSANTPEGWIQAVTWARTQDVTRSWGIENSGTLGKGCAQALLIQGETYVCDVGPQRTAQYRRHGRDMDVTRTRPTKRTPSRSRGCFWLEAITCRRYGATI